MRVIGYVRVSTDEQAANGASLAAQRDGIAQEAARRGWDVVGVHGDGGAAAGLSMAVPASLRPSGR